MSTKKALKTPSAAAEQINTVDNDWLVDLNQETCNHAWFYTTQFKEESDGWQYARLICQVCDHAWDAWSAPIAQNLLTLMAGFQGEQYDNPAGDDDNAN